MPTSEHVTRFYSLALGKYNNFNATTDGLISAGDTTPDVSLNSLLYANTAGTLAITDLDNGVEGQLVMIQNRGTGVVSFAGSCVITNSAALAQDQNITFKKNLTKWYQVSRGGDSASETVTVTLANRVATAGGSAGTVTVTNNTRFLVFAIPSTNILQGITGGYDGQQILVTANTSGTSLAIASGNIVCSNTASNIVMAVSDDLLMYKYNGQWHVMLPGVL